ncbi:MAG: CAP domain-containing protein [Candidatus Nanoarchaeia archaeon]|nr:CAP domain-containing protein [Candidatus Nanoarchaeia archaeon]
MKKCTHCNKNKPELEISYCKFCQDIFCLYDIQPEKHNCDGLENYKSRKHPLVQKFKDKIMYMADIGELKTFFNKKKGIKGFERRSKRIDSNYDSEKNNLVNKFEKLQPSFDFCEYHPCRKETEVSNCEICNKKFCQKHLHPKIPGMPRFKGTSKEDKLFMDEWRKDGHPCPKYIPFWEAENETKKEEYGRALNRLLSRGTNNLISKRTKIDSMDDDFDDYPRRKRNLWHSKNYISPSNSFNVGDLILAGFILFLLINLGPNLINSLNNFSDSAKDYLQPSNLEVDIADLELEVHTLINEQRKIYGLKSLSLDDNLAEIARLHSEDMAINGFFSHDDLKGFDPTDRAKRANYLCKKTYVRYYTDGIAENIMLTPIAFDVEGCGNTKELSNLAKCIVDGWMSSTGHRNNILTQTYDRQGIGIAISSDNKAYVTEDFC